MPRWLALMRIEIALPTEGLQAERRREGGEEEV